MLDIVYRFDPAQPPPPPPSTVAEAHERLCAGNRDFASLAVAALSPHPDVYVIPIDLRDLGLTGEGTAPRQEPFALVLGCSDARAPTEMIFHQTCNSLFVVRVAGNVLGNECLGSVDYAAGNLPSLRLIVVLGHSGCGAVTAAVDAFLQPSQYLSIASSHPLRSIVDRLFAAIRGATRALEVAYGMEVHAAPGYRRALIEASVVFNAALTAATLRDELDPARDHPFQIVYGVYDLATRYVNIPGLGRPSAPSELHAPPTSEEEMRVLAGRIVRSAEIKAWLAK